MAQLIQVGDQVSIEHENDILLGAIVWEINPMTIVFMWQGSLITQPRAWAEIHTELSRKYRDLLIEEILNLLEIA